MSSRNYFFKLSVNKQKNRRQSIAMFIRRLADLFDGRKSAAFDFESEPPLSDRQQIEIINQGLRSTNNLLGDETLASAVELVMREKYGELYGPPA